MIPLRVSIIAAVAAAALVLVVLELIRSRRLQERYALLWLLTGVVLFLLAIWRDALNRMADLTGIAYPPSALFVVASGFILVVLLHYSTVISKLSEQNTALTQRVAMLELRLEESTRELRARGPILVTGPQGFAGSNLVAQLGERALPTEVDVTDAESVAEAVRTSEPGAIVHLAAVSSVTASTEDPGEAWRVNVVGAVNVLGPLAHRRPKPES